MFLGKEKVNETLKELLAGIIIYGMICLLVGIPFVDSKCSYILGLVIGIMLAVFSAVNVTLAWLTFRKDIDNTDTPSSIGFVDFKVYKNNEEIKKSLVNFG